jgi:3-methyl-2-oxobutanoate hydroxymethyltransferase
MKVQGKDAQAAQLILDSAKILQDKGCFSLVLVCIPQELAKKITGELSIPTIGIGAGVFCDGQVLVSSDVLGLLSRQPKFSKKYLDLSPMIVKAFKQYAQDVQAGQFPDDEYSFHMNSQEIKKL